MQQFDEIRREEGSVYCQSLLLMLMSSASTPLVHTVKPNINLIYLVTYCSAGGGNKSFSNCVFSL